MLDYAIIAGVAIVGIFVVVYLFDSVSRVSTQQKKAIQVKQDIKQRVKQDQRAPASPVEKAAGQGKKKGGASKDAAPAPQQKQQQPAAAAATASKSPSPTSKATKSKKQLEAERKKQDEELDALVAREALRSNSGMRSEKLQVTTLEKAREQNRAKKNKGNNVAAEDTSVKPEFTEEQKAREKAHGFKIVEAEKPKEVAAAAAATGGNTNDGFKKAGRRASPKNAPKTEREELEAKLESFLFGNKKGRKNNRGGGGGDYDPPAASAKPAGAAKATISATAGVHMKEKIAAAPENAWQDEREW